MPWATEFCRPAIVQMLFRCAQALLFKIIQMKLKHKVIIKYEFIGANDDLDLYKNDLEYKQSIDKWVAAIKQSGSDNKYYSRVDIESISEKVGFSMWERMKWKLVTLIEEKK